MSAVVTAVARCGSDCNTNLRYFFRAAASQAVTLLHLVLLQLVQQCEAQAATCYVQTCGAFLAGGSPSPSSAFQQAAYAAVPTTPSDRRCVRADPGHTWTCRHTGSQMGSDRAHLMVARHLGELVVDPAHAANRTHER